MPHPTIERDERDGHHGRKQGVSDRTASASFLPRRQREVSTTMDGDRQEAREQSVVKARRATGFTNPSISSGFGWLNPALVALVLTASVLALDVLLPTYRVRKAAWWVA